MVPVGGRYIVGVGGPVGGVQSDMTVYDTLKEQEWTMVSTDAQRVLAMLDFPAVAAFPNASEMSFIVHGGKPGNASLTGAEGNTFSGLVHRVKLEHLAGNPPTVTVTILANAAEQPADLAPRYAHAAVIGGADSTTLFIHGGYNLDGGPGVRDAATACGANATDHVWAFDLVAMQWDNATVAMVGQCKLTPD